MTRVTHYTGEGFTTDPLPADVAFACRLHLLGQTQQTDQTVVVHLQATIDGSGSMTVVLRDVTTP